MSMMTKENREEASRFLEALTRGKLPEPERMIMCGFAHDPDKAPSISWRPRPWFPGRDIVLNDNDNAYVTVSSFYRAGDGSFRRRHETFAAGRALMVDDVGTKVPEERMRGRSGRLLLAPSAVVETSPGNFQWWFFLAEPERDGNRFDGVIRAFITGKLLGNDPGMSGVTRVGRLPGYMNTKEKYKTKEEPRGFRVRLRELEAERRYTVDELLGSFELRINGSRYLQTPKLITEEAKENNRRFVSIWRFLDSHGMLKRKHPDPSGWTEMRCPWAEGHTGGTDTGAAIREPAPENDYHGAFRCHHGHCVDRGFVELTEWINEVAIEELDAANDAARDKPSPPKKEAASSSGASA